MTMRAGWRANAAKAPPCQYLTNSPQFLCGAQPSTTSNLWPRHASTLAIGDDGRFQQDMPDAQGRPERALLNLEEPASATPACSVNARPSARWQAT